MKKKNLISLVDFARENNTADMDEMYKISLKGGGAGNTLEDSDGCLKSCTGTVLDPDIDGDDRR